MNQDIKSFTNNPRYKPYTENTDSYNIALILDAFEAHLRRTGKVCPRPWYWRRFFILFKPRYEPPWLSSWWKTSTQAKKEIFMKQAEYLAYRTSNFHEAYQYLNAIDDENWLFEWSEAC